MKCLLREPGKIVFLLELMAKDAALSANQDQVALKFIDPIDEIVIERLWVVNYRLKNILICPIT